MMSSCRRGNKPVSPEGLRSIRRARTRSVGTAFPSPENGSPDSRRRSLLEGVSAHISARTTHFGNADWAHGCVNGDLLGFLLFVIVGGFAAGRILGVDAAIEKTAAVRRRPWLRYLLG